MAPGSAEHAQVVDYLDAVTREAGLNARYRIGADMVELVAA
jgi:poly-gamma-glutamate synthesis protein (capsule biosynthesis protein)